MRVLPAVLLLAPISGLAQVTYELTGKPDATLEESFTILAGVRELPGNRAIVTDQMERAVYLVDFSSGTRRQIGRQGDGPGEYRFPMAPFAGPGDVTWVYDPTRRLVHVIAVDGTFGPSLSPPFGSVPGGLLQARGTDTRGNMYFEGNSFNSETGRFTDTVAVVRWNASTGASDIAGRVSSGGRVTVQRQGMTASMARSALPFPHVDAWAPLPDGRVVVVRQSPHTLAVFEANGALRASPVIPFPTIAISAAERDAYRERQSTSRMVAVGGGEMRRMQVEDAVFPENMPAFVYTSVITDPSGRIWVGRSHRFTDKTWRYDLYDAQGSAVGRATLPVGSRVVAFGREAVYIARTDPADDQVYLERFRLRP